jgi:hypothetical protein
VFKNKTDEKMVERALLKRQIENITLQDLHICQARRSHFPPGAVSRSF